MKKEIKIHSKFENLTKKVKICKMCILKLCVYCFFAGGYAGFHFGRGWMASAGARAYNRGLCPSGVQGQSPWWEVRGAKPPEAESYLL